MLAPGWSALCLCVFALLGLQEGVWASDDGAKLEEIIVTATRSPKDVSATPASVSVVSSEKFSYRNVQTIDQIVADVPGVAFLRYPNSMGGRITLRGFPDQKRTLILMDGIVLNNPYSGTVTFDGYYPEDVERVEVVRGPASNLYGGYAMGGVVHFMSRMPENREIALKAGYGSGFERGDAFDDRYRLYFSYGDKVFDKWRFLLRYGRQESNGYPTGFNVTTKVPPSEITGWKNTKTRYGQPAYLVGHLGDNSQWDDSFGAKIQYQLSSETNIGLSFMRSRMEYDYDDPKTYLSNGLDNPVWSYSGLSEKSFLPGGGGRTQNTYGFNAETRFGDVLTAKVNLALVDMEKSWYVSTLSGATRLGGPGYLSDTPCTNYMGDIQFSLVLSDVPIPFLREHLVTFGSAYTQGYAHSKEKNLSDWKKEESPGTLRYESKGKDRSWALFIQDEVPLRDRLTLYLGFRYDNWKTYDGSTVDIDQKTGQPKAGYPKEYDARSHDMLSPKLGLVYQPFDGTTLRASVGKSFRPPTVYDLYRTWTASSGTTYAANPGLKPETAVSWDIGGEQRLWGGASVSVTYFENYLSDLIYRKSVSPTLQEHVNVGKAESRGVEAEVQQKLWQWLTLYGNLTYTDSEITENEAKPETVGKQLNSLPLWQGNLGVRAARGPFRASISGRYVGKRYNDDTNADKQNGVYGSYDPFWTADFKVAYDVRRWATVALSVDNLFDRDYYEYYKAPGRSFFVELSTKF